jgi:hypothetical protein
VYYRATYPDPDMHYPGIESFVFVGKNLSDEDTEDTRYFQFADSFAKHGPIPKVGGGDRRVSYLTQSELDNMLHDEGFLMTARSRCTMWT